MASGGYKHIILGVAFGWGRRKGFDVFVELSKHLDDTYKIVLVGTDIETDKKLPKDIISIHRTQDQIELASLYSKASVFVNPTREEVFGMTNIEALACGTPVITFNTGGSPECVDEFSGLVVEVEDVRILEQQIHTVCEKGMFDEASCVNRARKFENEKVYNEYIEIYKR